jgi:hypothetical protein
MAKKILGFPRNQSMTNDPESQRLQDAHHLSFDAPQKIMMTLGLATPKRASIRAGHHMSHGNILVSKNSGSKPIGHKGMGPSRRLAGPSFSSIYQNQKKDSIIQSSERIIDEEDYPKPQTVQESFFEWPPRDSKSILSHLKLKNLGFHYPNGYPTTENRATEASKQDDNISTQTRSCKGLDIPPHYGAYSNK